MVQRSSATSRGTVTGSEILSHDLDISTHAQVVYSPSSLNAENDTLGKITQQLFSISCIVQLGKYTKRLNSSCMFELW